MTGNNTSIVEQFKPPPKAKSRLEVIQEEKPFQPANTSYRAYRVTAPQKRPTMLRIEYGDGVIGLMSKNYLIEVLCASHQGLSLIFTNCVITLDGRNLDILLEEIEDENVGSLHCFNPKLHKGQEPPDGEAVITRIERVSIQEFKANSSNKKK